jgi:hypothetical protein
VEHARLPFGGPVIVAVNSIESLIISPDVSQEGCDVCEEGWEYGIVGF